MSTKCLSINAEDTNTIITTKANKGLHQALYDMTVGSRQGLTSVLQSSLTDKSKSTRILFEALVVAINSKINNRATIPHTIPNLYSVPIIFVLKIQHDFSKRTKVITQKPS